MTRHFTTEAEVVRWNETMARKYDSEDFHLRSSFLVRWVERRRVAAVLRLLESGPDDHVLEVGCGTGVVLAQIPARRRVGVDLSRFALEKAKRNLASSNATLVQGNAEALPLKSQTLEKIVCTEVIEHVVSPSRLSREIARVATENATVVMTVPNEALIERVKALISRLGLSRWLLKGTEGDTGQAYNATSDPNEWHLHRFDLALLESVTRGSLVIERVKAVPFGFLPLRYVVRFRIPISP